MAKWSESVIPMNGGTLDKFQVVLTAKRVIDSLLSPRVRWCMLLVRRKLGDKVYKSSILLKMEKNSVRGEGLIRIEI